MQPAKPRHSFRSVMSIATLICWLLPIIIISTTAGVLLNRNYNRNLRRSTEADLSSAMRQVEIRLNYVLEDSKSVSYDGVVYQAYRDFMHGTEQSETNRTISDYLAQKFSRNVLYRSAILSFANEDLSIMPYTAAPGVFSPELLRDFEDTVMQTAIEVSEELGTGIQFLVLGDRLYMVRNLLDGNYVKYAMLVIELEKAELMQSFYGLSRNQTLTVTLDGVAIPLGISAETTAMHPSRMADLTCSSEVDGHTLICRGQVIGLNIWTTVPMLRWIVLFVGSLVVPMLVIIVLLFLRNINHPIETLINATSRIQRGERGFQITKKAPNSEFAQLYHNFNAMSCELKSQFDRLYEEQQALQQAKIKALQSQINPHFLNNTLEIINWEARFADNERVCSMIEALSTMLDAAIGRDGRSQILLSEELKYVEAYLYITKQRLGDRLTIVRQIAPETLNCTVPLLMLQPILENAVEYDLTRTGGVLCLKSYLKDGLLHLEVNHDGNISPEGWSKIRRGLSADPVGKIDGRSVGIRNVVNRLWLLYGGDASIGIQEISPGKIQAKIILPTSVRPNPAQNQQ